MEESGEKMFLGQYEHSLDEKGRVIMPAKFREDLGDSFVITFGLDKCLFIYPMEEWEKLAHNLEALPFGKKDTRAFKRTLASRALISRFDQQGRVVLAKYLRDYAEIEKNVIIIGVFERIEIWDMKKWKGYAEETEQAYEDIAERIYEKEGLDQE
ncbi:MAG: Protein MraZ [Atribacteria bacterium 34_128]|nr:MAG: Protein MraZ [Atribacteria bacterium 34_128]